MSVSLIVSQINTDFLLQFSYACDIVGVFGKNKLTSACMFHKKTSRLAVIKVILN